MTPPDDADLTIDYRRSGGLAGVELIATAQGRELSDDDAATAGALLDDPPAVAGAGATSRRSDQFDHQLTLTRGTSRRSYHWADADVPGRARGLLDTLVRRAVPTR